MLFLVTSAILPPITVSSRMTDVAQQSSKQNENRPAAFVQSEFWFSVLGHFSYLGI